MEFLNFIVDFYGQKIFSANGADLPKLDQCYKTKVNF